VGQAPRRSARAKASRDLPRIHRPFGGSGGRRHPPRGQGAGRSPQPGGARGASGLKFKRRGGRRPARARDWARRRARGGGWKAARRRALAPQEAGVTRGQHGGRGAPGPKPTETALSRHGHHRRPSGPRHRPARGGTAGTRHDPQPCGTGGTGPTGTKAPQRRAAMGAAQRSNRPGPGRQPARRRGAGGPRARPGLWGPTQRERAERRGTQRSPSPARRRQTGGSRRQQTEGETAPAPHWAGTAQKAPDRGRHRASAKAQPYGPLPPGSTPPSSP